MKAEKLLIETISLQEDVYGANHAKTLRTKGNYAYVIKKLGRTEQALKIEEEQVRVGERQLGPLHK